MDLTLRLPDELLARVIEGTHYRSPVFDSSFDFHRLPSFLVCRRWYSVAIKCPMYWQYITIEFPAGMIHIENCLLRLERADHRPVDLTLLGRAWPQLTTWDLGPLQFDLMPALTSHMDHIRSLRIIGLQDVIAGVVLAALTVPAPILIHFGFQTHNTAFILMHPTWCFLPRNIFGDSAPALRSLQLRHFQPLWPIYADTPDPELPNWTQQITQLELEYDGTFPPIVFHDVFPCVQELKLYWEDTVHAFYAVPGRHPPALGRVIVYSSSERQKAEIDIRPALPGAPCISVAHASILTVQRLTQELVAPQSALGAAVEPPYLKYLIVEAERGWADHEEFTVSISDHGRGRTREFTEDLTFWSKTTPFYHSHPPMLANPLDPGECAPNELLSRVEVMNRVVELETSLYLLTKLAHHLPRELPVLKHVTLVLTVRGSGQEIPPDREEILLKMRPIACPLLEVVTIKDAQTYFRPRRVPLNELQLLVDAIFAGLPQLRALNVDIY